MMNAPVRWTTTNMTSKGQVLIPKGMRDALGLVPGGAVQVGVEEGGTAAMVRAEAAAAETGEQRREDFMQALKRARAAHRTDCSTAEIMNFLRGDEPLP